jgi:hypothetical protein
VELPCDGVVERWPGDPVEPRDERNRKQREKGDRAGGASA